MVFLFPGILFRKFYFNGDFTSQFNHGNLLERFLWTLFFSILSLFFCGLLIYLVTVFFELEFIHNIDFCTINGIFENLASNKYPHAFGNEGKVSEIGLVIGIIWLMSAIFGYFAFKFVRVFAFDYRSSILRFNNEWHYLGIASRENGIERKWGDNFVTFLDILILKKEKEELYRGRLKKIFLDRENKIEEIVIENPSKFIPIEKIPDNAAKIESLTLACNSANSPLSIHNDFSDKIVFKKEITGKIFVLPYQHVINLNISYLKISNRLVDLKRQFLRILLILFYMVLLAITVFPFIKFDNRFFDTFLEKLFFSIVSLFTATLVFDSLKSLFQGREVFKKKLRENFFFLILFSVPYLFVFEISSWWATILFFIAGLALVGRFVKKEEQL